MSLDSARSLLEFDKVNTLADAYQLLLKLKERAQPFSLKELFRDFPLSEDSLEFFNVLFRKGVFEDDGHFRHFGLSPNAEYS